MNGPGDDPFESLLRSHRRLEERLADLNQASVTGDVGAVFDVLGFFDRAVARHEQDEERSLFPRLGGVAELEGVLARLAAEHREHERLHAELRALAEPWEGRAPDEAELNRLGRIAGDLEAAYRSHIHEEEKVLFPAARAQLDAAALAAIVDEMAARRPNRGQGGRNPR
ncbi:MAG TPA: hemerythrin domain-containing protein [Polyangia bacterium]|nr:hemerythrin domain-containing protein [Polyangia bacterium]